jgi:radial spoke head protein 4/6
MQYECEDILNDAHLLDSLGVGLGRREMYGVMLAVKQLGEDPKRAVSTVRFFGKFLGIFADYFVFETTLQNPPEEEEKQLGEPMAVPASAPTNAAAAYTTLAGNAAVVSSNTGMASIWTGVINCHCMHS